MRLRTLTFVVVLFSTVLVSSAASAASLEGCVYDKNTGEKVKETFVIRTFTRGTSAGVASAHTDGCFSGGIIADPSPDAWDFIEVLYVENGRLYTQQYKLPPTASSIGFPFLGIADDTLRYDFFLDILP